MKTNFIIIAAAILIGLNLHSCSGGIFKNELNAIDSLQIELGRIEKELSLMDTIYLDTISTNASNNINTIKHVFEADTVDMKVAKTISNYKFLRKVSNKFKQTRLQLWSELKLSKNQLTNLSNDLKNGAYDEETGKKYFSLEKLATSGLIQAYQVHKAEFENSVKQYDSLNPVIKDIIQLHLGNKSNKEE